MTSFVMVAENYVERDPIRGQNSINAYEKIDLDSHNHVI
jgi:hypothetical protein